jgi:hypothetical protein
MTEPETPPRRGQKRDASEQGDNVLQNKVFGLPVWMYLVAIGLLVLIVIYYRRNQSQVDTSTTDGTIPGRLVPPFINQVYVNPEPPEGGISHEGPPGLERLIDRPSHVFKTTKAWENFHKLAAAHNMTDQELAELNPGLADKFMNTGRRIPKGTSIRTYKKKAGYHG